MEHSRENSLQRWASETLRALRFASDEIDVKTLDEFARREDERAFARANATTDDDIVERRTRRRVERNRKGNDDDVAARRRAKGGTRTKEGGEMTEKDVEGGEASERGANVGATLEDVWRGIQLRRGSLGNDVFDDRANVRDAFTGGSVASALSLGTMKFSDLLSAMAAPVASDVGGVGNERDDDDKGRRKGTEGRGGGRDNAPIVPGVSYEPVKLKKRSNIPTPKGTRPTLPPKRMGRRPKDAAPESEDEKRLRMEERLFRNRESAARSREKRVSAMRVVEDENARLREENAALKATISKLQSAIEQKTSGADKKRRAV